MSIAFLAAVFLSSLSEEEDEDDDDDDDDDDDEDDDEDDDDDDLDFFFTVFADLDPLSWSLLSSELESEELEDLEAGFLVAATGALFFVSPSLSLSLDSEELDDVEAEDFVALLPLTRAFFFSSSDDWDSLEDDEEEEAGDFGLALAFALPGFAGALELSSEDEDSESASESESEEEELEAESFVFAAGFLISFGGELCFNSPVLISGEEVKVWLDLAASSESDEELELELESESDSDEDEPPEGFSLVDALALLAASRGFLRSVRHFATSSSRGGTSTPLVVTSSPFTSFVRFRASLV